MGAVYRWDVMWGHTRRQIADDYILTGKAKRRKDGGWDRRYRASRFVEDVESGRPSLLA
jgi:hypothetical protein